MCAHVHDMHVVCICATKYFCSLLYPEHTMRQSVGRDSPTPNLAKIHQFSITSHHHGGQQSGCKPSFPAVPDYHTCTRVFVGYHEQILQVVWSNYSIIVLHHEFSDSIRSGRHDSSIVNASHL